MPGPNNETVGLGTELWLKPPGGTLTKVANLITLPELPAGTRNLLSATTMDTDGMKKYWKSPLADGNEVTAEVHWVDGSATDDLMQDCEAADGDCEYRLVVPKHDGTFTKREGTLIVLSYRIMNPFEDNRMGQLVYKPTSVPTSGTYTPPA